MEPIRPTFARPLKVMHLVPRLWRGGMEHNVVKLTNALDRTRVASSICSCLPADYLKDLLRNDVPLYEFRRRDGNDPSLVVDLVRVFRRERPDIVHSHTWGTLCEGFLAARLAGVPVIVHGEHGTMNLRPRNRIIQRLLWNRVDRLLSVSRTLAETMVETVGVDRRRIHVIHNGVNVERFTSGVRRQVRDELGLRDDEVLIVTVGRLEPVKDHEGLIAAVAQIRQTRVPFRVALVGDGALREQLQQAVERQGVNSVVSFLGHRNDVADVLAAADLFVLSSRSEGLPNGIMEAMAAGLPVVSTAVGGATELVVHGATGLLVPPAAPQALAGALESFICDDARRTAFGEAGKRRVLEQFAFDRMVEQYEELYLGAAQASPRLSSVFRRH